MGMDGDGFKINKQWRKQTPETFNAWPTKATYFTYLHLQWRWNRGNSCSTISNVPMYVKETEARPFGISCSQISKCCLGSGTARDKGD